MTDGGDEELLSAGRPPEQRRRLRSDIAIGLGGLVAALLVARALSSGNSTKPAPSPGPTASSTVSLTGPPPRGVFTFGPSTVAGGPGQLVIAGTCQPTAAQQCTLSHRSPPGVTAALSLAFPGIFVDETDTQTLRGGGRSALWSRLVSAHDRHTYLTIVVSRFGPRGDTVQQTETNGQTTIYLRVQHKPYTVQVELIGLPGSHPSQGQVTLLANDPRLLRSG